MKRPGTFAVCLLMALAFARSRAVAQSPCPANLPLTADFDAGTSACATIPQGSFTATPFIDSGCQLPPNPPSCPSYGDPDNNTVSLYGAIGNVENTTLFPAAQAHYQLGISLAENRFRPLCRDGSNPDSQDHCPNGQPDGALIFLAIGMSNCDIEICGGNVDIWQGQGQDPNRLPGQPCATQCPNPGNAGGHKPWNSIPGDPVQKSLLYLAYSPAQHLVGNDVVIFDGAASGQVLSTWDTTGLGYYSTNACTFEGGSGSDPECNYDRVRQELAANGYGEPQVEAIFLKDADPMPSRDLKHLYGRPGDLPDAYVAERYLGDIMRYLHCGPLNSNRTCPGIRAPRYPNLQQVFISSRIYGGWANQQMDSSGELVGCLNPEPFAYELGFAVQRLVVAQINSVDDGYSGAVDTGNAPWLDWGPYLWANTTSVRSDGLVWCNNNPPVPICAGVRDLRYGDLTAGYTQYWGDLTHPADSGVQKVAQQLVNFIGGNPLVSGSPWVTPWIGK